MVNTRNDIQAMVIGGLYPQETQRRPRAIDQPGEGAPPEERARQRRDPTAYEEQRLEEYRRRNEDPGAAVQDERKGRTAQKALAAYQGLQAAEDKSYYSKLMGIDDFA